MNTATATPAKNRDQSAADDAKLAAVVDAYPAMARARKQMLVPRHPGG
jgi:hypothetical protein